MYTLHTHCRACGYAASGAPGTKSGKPDSLVTAFDLGIQPLANDFCKAEQARAGYFPLKVMVCPKCFLGQLSVVVSPETLYRNYKYVTSPSKTMHDHFEGLIKNIRDAIGAGDAKVLEIGSNDGLLLQMMQKEGFACVGVDPAENLSAVARDRGVSTVVGFFTHYLARSLPDSDVVIARHVFCHVNDWHDFVRGLEEVTNPKSLVCIEVPYLGDMLEQCAFDTIYHEHLSYLSIQAVHHLLEKSKLFLYRIIRYPIHGGCVMLMLRRRDSGIPVHSSVHRFCESISMENWKQFAVKAQSHIDQLRSYVRDVRANGKRVAGLGASAKSTVWVNACGFTHQDIEFIADNTPQKQYTVSPGTDIPICDEGAVLRELPDYVIMWAWNYRDEILTKFSLAREKGVKFIIPVNEISVV